MPDLPNLDIRGNGTGGVNGTGQNYLAAQQDASFGDYEVVGEVLIIVSKSPCSV